MAFAFAITSKESMGSKFLAHGTYTSTGGSTGGDVNTGLSHVEGFWMQPRAAAVIANAPTHNQALPVHDIDGTIPIITAADEVGYWYAFGY